MRAKTVTHVEYEIFEHILATIDIADVKDRLVPPGDNVAEKRFNEGAKSAARYVKNLSDRRLHRLPNAHPDYRGK